MNEYLRAGPEEDNKLRSGLLCKNLRDRKSTSGNRLKVTVHVLPEPWVFSRSGQARGRGHAKHCDPPWHPASLELQLQTTDSVDSHHDRLLDELVSGLGLSRADCANKPGFPELWRRHSTQGHAHWFLTTLESLRKDVRTATGEGGGKERHNSSTHNEISV